MADARKPYPPYRTYDHAKNPPSLLKHDFPRPAFAPGELYYPPSRLLESRFASAEESRRFGAAMFCGFLEDTIEVEHNLVIPAVSMLRRLPYEIPVQAEQDLYATATDEGFHAEQSLQFTSDLRERYCLRRSEEFRMPLFLRRLEEQRAAEPRPDYQYLITVLNGVVTETRISLELGEFANNKALAPEVREVCSTHAEDEAIHASQFRALGQFLWGEFDEPTRVAAARFITASTIARSLPDVPRIAHFFQQVTGRSLEDAQRIVYEVYSENVSIDELLFASRPTVKFIRELGVEQYMPFDRAIEDERRKLAGELAAQCKASQFVVRGSGRATGSTRAERAEGLPDA
ncbi:MAG: diiron oxygenase [Planctomycetota bacterium]